MGSIPTSLTNSKENLGWQSPPGQHNRYLRH